MEQHPGIVFRSGPGGRRAGLMSGPDVWEVMRAVLGGGVGEGDADEGVGERTGLTTEQVGAALRYYAEYKEEVRDWIAQVDEEAERAEAAWRGEQELRGR